MNNDHYLPLYVFKVSRYDIHGEVGTLCHWTFAIENNNKRKRLWNIHWKGKLRYRGWHRCHFKQSDRTVRPNVWYFTSERVWDVPEGMKSIKWFLLEDLIEFPKQSWHNNFTSQYERILQVISNSIISDYGSCYKGINMKQKRY